MMGTAAHSGMFFWRVYRRPAALNPNQPASVTITDPGPSFPDGVYSYTARQIEEQGVAIIRLTDAAHATEVSVMPSAGNRAYEMKVHGHNVLYTAATDLAQYSRRPPLDSVPFLAPWANRLDEPAFWANGKKYTLNPGLHNFSINGSIPIHGLLTTSPLWRVTEVSADEHSAHVTSKLEFCLSVCLYASSV